MTFTEGLTLQGWAGFSLQQAPEDTRPYHSLHARKEGKRVTTTISSYAAVWELDLGQGILIDLLRALVVQTLQSLPDTTSP